MRSYCLHISSDKRSLLRFPGIRVFFLAPVHVSVECLLLSFRTFDDRGHDTEQLGDFSAPSLIWVAFRCTGARVPASLGLTNKLRAPFQESSIYLSFVSDCLYLHRF